VGWGKDLQSEHERYLVEKHYKKPVIITDYPKTIKAFYMKQNDDGKTVRALDVLFPRIGEIIGGSQREEDYDKLSQRIEELKIPTKDLWWYLETRKFGTVPHSGFGLGFERLVLFITGMSNIRDVIPFPRTPKNAEF
jgi:asparaginyl-tRNA synthetase